jgi:hypothetical protein|tara:strand:- start:36 stop:242 length:207 start_codon:yes stop_codon:yes gene_type:complete
MSYTKELDLKAKNIAEDIIKDDIYKACDWALDDDDFQNLEGNEYNEAHSYLMSSVARHIANKLLIDKL